MTNGTNHTPESNARNVAALTSAVDMLVSQFIRPSAQQANANRETLGRVADLLERHAEGMLNLEARLDQLTNGVEQATTRLGRLEEIVSNIATQQQANAQQITQNAEAIAQFDERLEETRQLVAKNSADFARMNTETKANLDQLIDENRAFRESQRSQLTAIIGNARRIERLEQQAS